MVTIGPLGFTAPAILAALAVLPVLWFILRAIPPRPAVITFPGIALLYGLTDRARVARQMPWWLLLLRVLVIAAAILAAAGPVWRPVAGITEDAPLLVIVDAGATAAPGWATAQSRGVAALEAASRDTRPAALVLGDQRIGQVGLVFGDGAVAAAQLRAAQPQAWVTGYSKNPAQALVDAPARFNTLWISDGLDHPARADWLSALTARGQVTVLPPAVAVHALTLEPGDPPVLTVQSTLPGPLPQVEAIGPDPQGVARVLARLTPTAPRVQGGITVATIPVDLPTELRNRVTRFAIAAASGAAAVVLTDDRVRRAKVAILQEAGQAVGEGQQLLTPAHYLRASLRPMSDLIEGGLSDILPAAPDVIVMADQPTPAAPDALVAWVNAGGLLIRFAGPRMASAPDLADDPLSPVRLRPGGRDLGGALSWGAPRGIAPFPEDGPFAGLTPAKDATMRAQLLPEPSPDLAGAVLARLTDGTPFITRRAMGKGAVVLVHTSANAEWSDLSLSGLFPQLLARLLDMAGRRGADQKAASAQPASWTASEILDGYGRLSGPGDLAPVSAADFAAGPGPGRPAGLYQAGARQAALNIGASISLAQWPGATIASATDRPGHPLWGAFIVAAAVLLMLDSLASALIAGQRRRRIA